MREPVGRDLRVAHALPVEIVLGRQQRRGSRFLRVKGEPAEGGEGNCCDERFIEHPCSGTLRRGALQALHRRRRFGVRASDSSNCAAASFIRFCSSSHSPYSSNDGLIGSAGPDGASSVASIAVASFSSCSAPAVSFFAAASAAPTSFSMIANGFARYAFDPDSACVRIAFSFSSADVGASSRSLSLAALQTGGEHARRVAVVARRAAVAHGRRSAARSFSHFARLDHLTRLHRARSRC